MKAVIPALVAALVVPISLSVGLSFGPPASAAPPGDDEVVAFVVRGVGNGHGRGLSQWGAFGRSVDEQSWETILDAYYGGTVPGVRANQSVRVRLTGWDGANELTVISPPGSAKWSSLTEIDPNLYSSIKAVETSPNIFKIFGRSDVGCVESLDLTIPFVNLQFGSADSDEVVLLQEFLTHFGHDPHGVDGIFGNLTKAAVEAFQLEVGLTADGLWRIEEANAAQAMVDAAGGTVVWGNPIAEKVAGPIRFETLENESTGLAADALGSCRSNGAITHYRGVIELVDVVGSNRVVNEVDVENYLRGVVPKEVPASWGDFGGMNALRAQSVAARSYGLAQSKYSYADTCDTTSCQVYGGAATRTSATGSHSLVEHTNTDLAIADTVAVVREWPDGSIVSTEFSGSNGPRTAGGTFPPVDDPLDDVPGNQHHVWTRIIDADSITSRYGLSTANGVRTVLEDDPSIQYDGVWANEVLLGNGKSVSAWDFRKAFGLPSPGFELFPVYRDLTLPTDVAFIGDSVGESVAGSETSTFPILLDGVFNAAQFDSRVGRRTQGGSGTDGVDAANDVPIGTELVVVELGYNDDPSQMPGRIDAVMTILRARDVGLVAWVNTSERRPHYGLTNEALSDAVSRWTELIVLDWESASDHPEADRWFLDDVHLRTTGRVEFSLWLRQRVLAIAGDGFTPPRPPAPGMPPRPLMPGTPLRVPVLGRAGIPEEGVVGIALNVTSVASVGPGFLRVWPCGAPEPTTSSVNFLFAGSVEPNAVVVPVDETGEICISTLVQTDVVVDVSAWFEAGLRSATGRLIDTREGERVVPGEPLQVDVRNRFGVPADGLVGVALNVTSVFPSGPGFLRVWGCGSEEPETSSVNFVSAGAVEPNAVLVPIDATGEVCVSTTVDTDVVVDIGGWFDSGLRPAIGRLIDTRQSDRVVPGETLRVDVRNRFGVPVEGAVGVALNVTSVFPAGPGFLRVWACGSAEPETSSVNFASVGTIEPNAVVVPIDQTGEVCISTSAATDVVVDISAWFDDYVHGGLPERIVDTRFGIGPIPGR